jgi:PST family polysaccharide transporter
MGPDQATDNGLASRSIVAASWEFGSVIGQAAMQLAVMTILARLIPPAEFGLYAIVNTSIVLISLVAEIGVGTAVVQRKMLSDGFLHTAFLTSIGLGLLGTVATWLASPLIAGFFKQPGVVPMVRAAGFALFITGYVVVAQSLLERELLYKKLAVINVVSYVIGYGCVGTVLALMRVGAWAIVFASLSQNLIRALMLMRMTKRKTVKARAFSKVDFKEILRFCTGVSIGKIFNSLAQQIDFLVVGRIMGAIPLGLYQMGNQIMDLPRRFLVGVIDRVMYSAFTRIQDDEARTRRAYVQSLELANVVLVPLAAFMIIIAPEAVALVLGNKWKDLVPPLQIMLLQVPLRASVRMGDITGTAMGRVYTIGGLKFLYAGMIGIAAFAGVRWGLTGVTVAVTLAVLANLVMMVRFTMTYVDVSVADYLRTWLPAVFMGAVVAVGAIPCAWIMRRQFGSNILTALAVTLVTVLLVTLILWFRPKTIGASALQVIMDFGRRFPFLARFCSALQKRAGGGTAP